jgi:hypothetical protein
MVDIQSALLQMAREKLTTSGGVADIKIDIPSGRYVVGGEGWFDGNPHPGDYVHLNILDDQDNIIIAFQDTALPAGEQGWFLRNGHMVIDKLVDGLDIGPEEGHHKVQILAYTGNGRADNFYVNIKWGVRI